LTEKKPPSPDPDSWEATKQVEAFIQRISDFDIEYTPDARTLSYPARPEEEVRKKYFWQKAKRTSFPNRISFQFLSYQQHKQAGSSPSILFPIVHTLSMYIQQAYANGLVRPGPAIFAKIASQNVEINKLQDQVKELTRKLGEKDYIIKSLGGEPEGDVIGP